MDPALHDPALHVPLPRPPAHLLGPTCEPGCPACAAQDRYNAEMRELNAEELEVRRLLACSEREAAAQLDAVRHKGQRKIDDKTIKRELRKGLRAGDPIKVIAGRLGVTERTVNNYKRKFREQLS
jgi:hypothetical protein